MIFRYNSPVHFRTELGNIFGWKEEFREQVTELARDEPVERWVFVSHRYTPWAYTTVSVLHGF